MESAAGMVMVSDPTVEFDEAPRTFTFDKVLDAQTSQQDVYSLTTEPIVASVIEGYNGTVFAYGQTGAGKTYTMEGKGRGEFSGIIPRAFEQIFSTIEEAEASTRFLVACSYVEIYNEEIRDLLSPECKRLEMKDLKKGSIIVDLTRPLVKSKDELMENMRRGTTMRSTAATLMNANSSRSHTIFSVYVERADKKEGESTERIRAAKLNLVDLAGSERMSKTGATGDRLKEATKINFSLSALGNVISALVEGKSKHIPYRDSKLTRLLQDSLGGNTKTVVIANVSPASSNHDETVTTLRFADRAKHLVNCPIINEDPKDTVIRQLVSEISLLRDMIMKSAETNTPLDPSEVQKVFMSTSVISGLGGGSGASTIGSTAGGMGKLAVDPSGSPKVIRRKLPALMEGGVSLSSTMNSNRNSPQSKTASTSGPSSSPTKGRRPLSAASAASSSAPQTGSLNSTSVYRSTGAATSRVGGAGGILGRGANYPSPVKTHKLASITPPDSPNPLSPPVKKRAPSSSVFASQESPMASPVPTRNGSRHPSTVVEAGVHKNLMQDELLERDVSSAPPVKKSHSKAPAKDEETLLLTEFSSADFNDAKGRSPARPPRLSQRPKSLKPLDESSVPSSPVSREQSALAKDAPASTRRLATLPLAKPGKPSPHTEAFLNNSAPLEGKLSGGRQASSEDTADSPAAAKSKRGPSKRRHAQAAEENHEEEKELSGGSALLPAAAAAASQSPAASGVAAEAPASALQGVGVRYGVHEWGDGSFYEGYFKDNNVHGQGTYKWADGRKYHGEWRDGAMDGQGRFEWPDGRIYDGDFKDKLRDGRGIFRWADGREFLGEWLAGKQNGYGAMRKAGKTSLKWGIWEDGERKAWVDRSVVETANPHLVVFVEGDRPAEAGDMLTTQSGNLTTSAYLSGLQTVGNTTGGALAGASVMVGLSEEGLVVGDDYMKAAANAMIKGKRVIA